MSVSDSEKLKRIFQQGDLEIKGQFTLGSNYTFLVDVSYQGEIIPAVYKPTRGERPLWDFETNSLALRETAAYIVSEALGFHIVPFTTLRKDGPHGGGSLQLYIDYDPNYHYFTFKPEDKQALRPVVLFDLLTNNADRKGGHVFFENGTHNLFAIDHGICFHETDKLRTVIWDFGGEPIPDGLLAHLSIDPNLLSDLQPYLSPNELTALQSRADHIRKRGTFPRQPDDRRAVPWPPL